MSYNLLNTNLKLLFKLMYNLSYLFYSFDYISNIITFIALVSYIKLNIYNIYFVVLFFKKEYIHIF